VIVCVQVGEHEDPLRAALDASERGDVVYLTDERYLHRAGALDVVVEGVRETDADYVSIYDDPRRYWGGSPPEPGDVVPSRTCHWISRTSLPDSFACRRGVLERDLDVLDRPDRWSRLAARGRRLRSSLPAFATLVEPGLVAPCFPVDELAAARPRRPSAVSDPTSIGVLPDVSPDFCDALEDAFPRARLVRLDSVDEAARAAIDAAAVTNVGKERLDLALREAGRPLVAVFVEIAAADQWRSLRWIPGRDRILPARAEGSWVV